MKKHLLSACLGIALFTGCDAPTPRSEPQGHAVAPVIPDVVRASDASVRVEVSTGMPELDFPATETVVAHAFALTHEEPCRVDHLRRMAELRALGELSAALLEARRAVKDAPLDTVGIEAVAHLARRAKDYSMAAVAYGELARLVPEDAAPLVQQARMLLELHDGGGALEAAEAALLRDLTSVDANHLKGRAHLELGELDGAIAAFERTLELSPDHGHALNNLGFAYLRANQNEDALDALERAAELLPHVAYVQNNLGVALERLGRTDEAREAFLAAMDLSPRYVKAILNSRRLEQLASAGGAVDTSGNGDGEALEAPVEVLPEQAQEE